MLYTACDVRCTATNDDTGTGVGAATDSRQLLYSRVHSSLVVAYSVVRHTWVGCTLEYATPG